MTKAASTRQQILEKAFQLIYQNGYQATSIDKIIDKTAVTKGAFYYHFKNKEDMGVAMIREVIQPRLEDSLLKPLRSSSDPIEDIYRVIEHKLLNDNDYYVDHGCPTNNLVQEMSPINLKFHKTLRNVLDRWVHTIQQALEMGKAHGKVGSDIDTRAAAEFIVVSYEGLKSLGKIYGPDLYRSYLLQLKNYLETMR